MYCANCGSELINNAAFCSKCGEKVQSIKSTEKEKDKKEKEIVDVKVETKYQNATEGKRFVNFLFDYVLISYILIPSLIVFLFPDAEEIPQSVIYFLLIILYFFLFETLTGKTLGKLITRTKVLNLLDEKPSAEQILFRTFSRFIPFEIFSFLSSRPVGWHDSISKTYVAEKVAS